MNVGQIEDGSGLLSVHLPYTYNPVISASLTPNIFPTYESPSVSFITGTYLTMSATYWRIPQKADFSDLLPTSALMDRTRHSGAGFDFQVGAISGGSLQIDDYTVGVVAAGAPFTLEVESNRSYEVTLGLSCADVILPGWDEHRDIEPFVMSVEGGCGTGTAMGWGGIASFTDMQGNRMALPEITSSIGDLRTNLSGIEFTPLLNAVPEPQSWAMLIVGFGLTGNVLRKRRSFRAANA